MVGWRQPKAGCTTFHITGPLRSLSPSSQTRTISPAQTSGVPGGLARFAARTLGKLPAFPLTESRVAALITRVVYPEMRMEWELGYAHAVTMEAALSLLVGRSKASG